MLLCCPLACWSTEEQGVGSARVADLFLESLFDTQISLVDLVQPVRLILGLLSGCDVGFHCGFFRGCFGRLVCQFLEDIFVVVACCVVMELIVFRFFSDSLLMPLVLSNGLNCSLATCLSCSMNLMTSLCWYWPASSKVSLIFFSCSMMLVLFLRRALQTALLMALSAWGFWSLLLWFWNRKQIEPVIATWCCYS